MLQAPPEKRRRTEEPEDSPLVKSTSYWFDDGSVIIQAENTQYRVHRSLLARHSNVFKDMFDLPQPAMDPGPTFEGCPVVYLSDKATDFEYVLSVIYDGVRVHDIRATTPMSVDFLGAILRLGKKYEIDYLCQEALGRLRVEFPTTLEEWQTGAAPYKHIEHGAGSKNMIRGIIDLVHELSIPRCLPIAYFLFVTSYKLEYILGNSADGGVLDRGDLLMQCVVGRDRLIHAYHAILENWMDEKLFLPSQHCNSWSTCVVNKTTVIRAFRLFHTEEDSANERPEDDYLPFLDVWGAEFDSQLCTPCLASMELAYKNACERLWSQLPEIFGLQPWDELRDFDM